MAAVNVGEKSSHVRGFLFEDADAFDMVAEDKLAVQPASSQAILSELFQFYIDARGQPEQPGCNEDPPRQSRANA